MRKEERARSLAALNTALLRENNELWEELHHQKATGKIEEIGAPAEAALLIETEPLPELCDRLPKMLGEALEVFEDSFERDIFLTAALPVLAGLMPEVRGYYGGRPYTPNLYCAAGMPPATGKGECHWARTLGSEVDRVLREQSAEAIAEWKRTNLARYVRGRDDRPCPPARSFYLPNDVRARPVLNALRERGGKSVIFQPEADTLIASLKSQGRTLHHLLDLAFHHETVSYMEGRKELQIQAPELSVFLATTPEGLTRMLASTEDGLFSRFLFYYTEGAFDWKTQRPTAQRREAFFEQSSKRLYDLWMQLMGRKEPLWYEPESGQWDLHDRIYRADLRKLYRSGRAHLTAVVKRNALMAWRIGMILTVLRQFEAGTALDKVGNLIPLDADFKSGLRLGRAYLSHSLALASLINGKADRPQDPRGTRQKKLLSMLHGKFTTAEALMRGLEMGYSIRSTKGYLRCLQGSHAIVRTGHGQYETTGM